MYIEDDNERQRKNNIRGKRLVRYLEDHDLFDTALDGFECKIDGFKYEKFENMDNPPEYSYAVNYYYLLVKVGSRDEFSYRGWLDEASLEEGIDKKSSFIDMIGNSSELYERVISINHINRDDVENYYFISSSSDNNILINKGISKVKKIISFK